MSETIEKYLVSTDSTFEHVIQRLDENSGGVVFIVDDNEIMKGILTDGDVRRLILKGISTDKVVNDLMNDNFVSGSINSSRSENIKLLNNKVHHLPILDESGIPVDMISWSDLWSLPIAQPFLGGNELKYITDCISTMWISSQGHYIEKFEESMVSFLGGGKGLCTSSGTTALTLSLAALGITSGDEVIVPNITFGATANAVIQLGAIPVFVDIDSRSKTMCPVAFQDAITNKTKAVIPVHLYGHPCDMDPILEIAKKFNIYVVEDCAESLGAEYKDKKVGLLGDVSCFSFFANKVITTGEGGMVVTKDDSLLGKMKLLRDHGMSPKRRYWHELPGYNFRMTNLQAAIGLAQMEQIDKFLIDRREIVDIYNKKLASIKTIVRPVEESWAKNIYWLYSIELQDNDSLITKNMLMTRLKSVGIESRPVFPPLNNQPAYRSDNINSYPVSEKFAKNGLSLPTANGMKIGDAERVCNLIKTILK